MFVEEVDSEEDHVGGLDVGEHRAAPQAGVRIQKSLREGEDDRESLRNSGLPHSCSLGSVVVMPKTSM